LADAAVSLAAEVFHNAGAAACAAVNDKPVEIAKTARKVAPKRRNFISSTLQMAEGSKTGLSLSGLNRASTFLRNHAGSAISRAETFTSNLTAGVGC
jgi:hypothetical protein